MAPNILSLHHVAINVRDLEEARIFYSDVLGFTELEAPAMAIEQGIRWFDLGDGRALHLIQTAESSPTGRAHFAISVSNAKAWRAHIEQAGLDILEPTVELYNANRFFLRDPWGNLFEFVQWLG